jgi:hypothetical protein
MTPTTSSQPRHRLELSATQVIASVLAAVVATVAASYLGVAGTVVGAAVASAVTVIGNALLGHGLRRTRERVVPTTRAVAATHDAPPELPARVVEAGEVRKLRRFGIASLSMFALILFALTAFELITGRPISDLVRGDSGSGTTLFGADTASTQTVQQPVRTQTVTVTQSVVVTTPTVTKTASAVTETTTPTVTTTPSSSAPSSSESTSSSASPSP